MGILRERFGLKRRAWRRWWSNRFRLVRNSLNGHNLTGSLRVVNLLISEVLRSILLLLLKLLFRHDIFLVLLLIENAVDNLWLFCFFRLLFEGVLGRNIFNGSFSLLLNLIKLARGRCLENIHILLLFLFLVVFLLNFFNLGI